MSTTRGAVRPAALATLALALVAASAAWWTLGGPRGGESAARPAQPAAPPEAFMEMPESERIDRPQAATGGKFRYRPEAYAAERYDGIARLEIALSVDGPPPESWTLELAPAKALMGAERAVERTLELPGDQRHVVLEDVALGGYAVRARAPGMECAPQFVELHKPDELDVVLALRLYPAGTLTGRVVDPDGDPVAGLPVVVRRSAAPEFTAHTDASGRYEFARLPDGEWVLAVGYPAAPLIQRELAFSAPGFSMPDLATPAIDELVVRVVDRELATVEGAHVSILGLASGAREAVTDANGVARLPHCVGGDATLVVELRDRPGSPATTQSIHFQPGVLTEHQVRLPAR